MAQHYKRCQTNENESTKQKRTKEQQPLELLHTKRVFGFAHHCSLITLVAKNLDFITTKLSNENGGKMPKTQKFGQNFV